MLDAILIVLMIKIGSNYKKAQETGASKHIVPAIACVAVAILLVLAGRAEENLTLMIFGLFCYIPAFIFVILGLKKSKALLAGQAAAGVPPISSGAEADPFTVIPEDFLFQSTPLQSLATPLPETEPKAPFAPEPIFVSEPEPLINEEPATISEPEHLVPEEPASVSEPEHLVPEEPTSVSEPERLLPEEPVTVSEPEHLLPEEPATVSEPEHLLPEEPATVSEPEPELPQPQEEQAVLLEEPTGTALPMHGFCNRCGAPLKGDAKFCHVCGALVKRGVRPNA